MPELERAEGKSVTTSCFPIRNITRTSKYDRGMLGSKRETTHINERPDKHKLHEKTVLRIRGG